jgi:predicted AAA+ superfamily ATPase
VIERVLQVVLLAQAGTFPAVTVTGPRQSGKTTLCRMAFPAKPYVSLEPPDVRGFAISDPRGFVAQYADGAVIDEVQRVPGLASYLQVELDAQPTPGRFILTGSANLALLQPVSQSLAGRTALLTLLPLGHEEVLRFPARGSPAQTDDLFTTLWRGGYPVLFDRQLPPTEWLGAYVATYVERDVRQLLNVVDLLAFQTFLRLCAGRVAQLLNLSALGADAGVTHNTARAWLSVLESSYIACRLPPLHANLRKRLIRTSKLLFYDSGLLCYLLGIREPAQLRHHPLRGAVFETWVISEILKARAHRGLPAQTWFYRDRKGEKIDLVIDSGDGLTLVEVKSGQTVPDDAFPALTRAAASVVLAVPGRLVRRVLVYGGDTRAKRNDTELVPWHQLHTIDWS